MYEFGFAKVDITAYEPGMAMLGWGQLYNRASGVARPLHARAVVIGDPERGTQVAYVSVELLLVDAAVRSSVVEALERDHSELGLGAHNIILSATHTHSGPSGFSHYFWINLAGPGYSAMVFKAVSEGIVEAIRLAARARRPGRIRLIQGEVPHVDAIAFNRSWFAYSGNRDVDPVPFERRDEARDATMTVLRFEDPAGRPVGMLNWFALHCTCVHADNTLLHPDHKGVAASTFEASDGKGPLHAIFAQEAAGDISPNYRYHAGRRRVIGRFDDDLRSAEYVGEVQSRRARGLFVDAASAPELSGSIRTSLRHVDFSKARIDPRHTDGRTGLRTTPARLGLAMVGGTAEGPGPLYASRLVPALSKVAAQADRLRARLQLNYRRAFDPKVPFLDLGAGLDGRLLGLFGLRGFALPAWDPVSRYVKERCRSGAVADGPWIPQVIPVQLCRIGQLAIAATPFEVTTVAGRRLRDVLLGALGKSGVECVVINTYANAYVGYLTTFEEYQCQHYEAGYTLFGPWSLAALQTAYVEVAAGLDSPRSAGPSEPVQHRYSEADLLKCRFDKPWPGQ